MLAPKIVLPGRHRLNEYSVCAPYGPLGVGLRKSFITTSDLNQGFASGLNYSLRGRLAPLTGSTVTIRELDLYGFRVIRQSNPSEIPDLYFPDNGTLFHIGVAAPGEGVGTVGTTTVTQNVIIGADGTVSARVILRAPDFNSYIIGGSFRVVLGSVYTVAIVFQSGQPTKLWVNGVQDPVTGTSGSNLPRGVFTLYNSFNGLTSYLYDRVLAGDEIRALSADPFCFVHTPSRRNTSFLAAPPVALPTLVQPISTTSAGAWVATGDPTLHGATNEPTRNDTTYISTSQATSGTFQFAESAFPGGAMQSFSVVASSPYGTNLTVTLFQGTTVIMARAVALTEADTLYTFGLTPSEISLIVAGPISGTFTTSQGA